jgi:hypothetical protein
MLPAGTAAPDRVAPFAHTKRVAPSGEVVRVVDGPAVNAGAADTVCRGPAP